LDRSNLTYFLAHAHALILVCLVHCFSTSLLLSLEGGEIDSNKVETKEAN
jgi:hypothetical protein